MRRLCVVAAPALLCGAALAGAGTWNAQAPSSRLGFTGTQAGAHFDGTFARFESGVKFDPNDLPGSRIEVKIDLTSVDTEDKDRDAVLRGPDLFAVERFPAAHYVATNFSRVDNGQDYTGRGELTLRDVTREVPIHFSLKGPVDSLHLVGNAELNRLDFGVGQGEWQDTEWVGDRVEVHFDLELEPRTNAQ